MLDSKQIQEIIPHRPPFLLVDVITELVPGERAVGYKNVTSSEPYFQGHFPQEPVMPGVLIIEALAQTGAVALLSLDEFKGKIAYFGGIRNARFRRKVVPGDQITLSVSISKMRLGMGIGQAVAKVGNEICATGELVFAVG